MLLNTKQTYGLIAQLLHWTTAALILVLIPLGMLMQELPASTTDEAVRKYWYYSLHKTLGVTTFSVAVIRLAWAFIQPAPIPLNRDKKFEHLIAQTVHWLLYGTIILMPLTGWLHHSATEGFAPIWWPLAQDLPLIPKNAQLASLFSTAHFCTAVMLVVSIALHIAGVLKHVIVDRCETLRRMIPGARLTQFPKHPPFETNKPTAVLAVLGFIAVGIATFAMSNGNSGKPTASQNASKQAAKSDTNWQVDKSNSELAIQVIQSGTPVTGSFAKWDAKINFDPDNLDKARIDVEIDIASLALGGVSSDAKSPDFLNAIAYPTARFVSREVTRSGADSYEARGTLTLAGQTKPLTLPFDLKITGDRAVSSAKISLDRLVFGVGQKGYPGGSLVGINVLVEIKLKADRIPPA